MHAEDLNIDVAPTGEAAVTLTLTGEVDAATAPILDQALANAFASGCSHITLDMGDLQFMDSSGIRVLVRNGEHVRAGGGALRISAMSRPVQQLMDLTGLADVFCR